MKVDNDVARWSFTFKKPKKDEDISLFLKQLQRIPALQSDRLFLDCLPTLAEQGEDRRVDLDLVAGDR